MQNTSNIPIIPNTLINNFFIAGVDQQILSAKIQENKAYNIPPEVLFTMYESREQVSLYLQRVLPENLAVEYKAQDPKFYSILTTDATGLNQYFHVLVFYEEINEAEISSKDFDVVAEMLGRHFLQKKNANLKNRKKSNFREGSTSRLDLIDTGEGALARQKKQQMCVNRKQSRINIQTKDNKLLTVSNNEYFSQENQEIITVPQRKSVLSREEKKVKSEERRKHDHETRVKMVKLIADITNPIGSSKDSTDPYISNDNSLANINLQISDADYQTQMRSNGRGTKRNGLNAFQSMSYVIKKTPTDLKRPQKINVDKGQINVNQQVEHNFNTPKIGLIR